MSEFRRNIKKMKAEFFRGILFFLSAMLSIWSLAVFLLVFLVVPYMLSYIHYTMVVGYFISLFLIIKDLDFDDE